MSLAKYLLITADQDDPNLDIDDIPAFLAHMLSRVDWKRDLHFQTQTTIDTLDYSGTAINQGSKVVIAAAGPTIRDLPSEIHNDLTLPDGVTNARCVLPGILAVQAPSWTADSTDSGSLSSFCMSRSQQDPLKPFSISYPL